MPDTEPPKVKRPAYHVWMDPREDVGPTSPELADESLVYHHVLVSNGDQLRAELEASRHGIKQREHSFHLTNLWLWAAMVRTGVFTGNFKAFKLACVSYDPDRDRDEPHDKEDADLDELDEHPT